MKAMQSILWSYVKHEPIQLPQARWITNMKQYRHLGGWKEITKTIQELEKVGVLRKVHNLVSQRSYQKQLHCFLGQKTHHI